MGGLLLGACVEVELGAEVGPTSELDSESSFACLSSSRPVSAKIVSFS